MKILKDWEVHYVSPEGHRGKFLGPDKVGTAAEAMAIARHELGRGYKVTSARETWLSKHRRRKGAP